MFNHYFLFFGAILLTNLVNANVNLTCYECNSCTMTPMKISIENRQCVRIQITCIAADIHLIDLRGDRLHSNHSSVTCGQKLSYLSTCTINYRCCYTDRCNTYENTMLSSSSPSSLFILKIIVISFHIFLLFL
ncbi:unnamed protein product [Adineta steineri]|uniref:Uncharacterized protein n=1 Tax=Adineta steineri TaxID=433720 RepID=A0A814GH51_9BILA|nr:unnamed protein product [Adineta steineri]CAF0996307.1 unnamed protein product [Adineta steineri]CAF1319571.1 unnamed protein product [Adineta steineri]